MTRRGLPKLGTPLTEREKAVMAVVRLGKPNKLVAYSLGLCEATVKVHIRNVMSKLGARTRTAAVVALFGEREEQVAEMQAEIDSLRSTLTRICNLSKDGPISDLANAALEPDIAVSLRTALTAAADGSAFRIEALRAARQWIEENGFKRHARAVLAQIDDALRSERSDKK